MIPRFFGLSNLVVDRSAAAGDGIDLRVKPCGGKVKNSVLNVPNLRFNQQMKP